MLSRFFHPLAAILFAFASLAAAPVALSQDKREDACGGAINCDCENITGAGVLTNPYRQDCRRCEARIIAQCRSSYEAKADAYDAIVDAVTKVGYCQNVCSQIGPNPRPIPESAVPPETPEDANLPAALKKMRLVCARDERFRLVTEGGVRATGCMKGTRRNGLWIFSDPERQTVVEVYYSNGREVWRRERKRG